MALCEIPTEIRNLITQELERIEGALHDPQPDERYCQFYAAQQALAWALDPGQFKAPFETIQRDLVQPLIGTREDSEDCRAVRHHS